MNENIKPHVLVAMSGGVDSSVAAALLFEQGYPVTGMMLRLWNPDDLECENRCCTPESMAQARRVAAQLGIPFYVVDAREKFRQIVVQGFLDGYQRGVTPNPCFICNQKFRWNYLLEQADALGISYIATGHYARLKQSNDGKWQLLSGLDEWKDQSYMLSGLNQSELSRTIFPLGEYQKSEVREKARQLGLPVADRPESQDLCFIGGQDYRQFLQAQVPQTVQPGVIVNRKGEILGKHNGLAFYTIGQRKGLGVSSSAPLYVIDKDIAKNQLIIGMEEELGGNKLMASDLNWISGDLPPTSGHFMVKIRYKAEFVAADMDTINDKQVQVCFEKPLRDITPGQIVAFYSGDICLGGGIIQP
jgi:tRNA-specific 2-thiouridylase